MPTVTSPGKVVTAIGAHAWGYTAGLQPDGRIVVSGWVWTGTEYDFAVARYMADGRLDSTFGRGGYVTTNLGTSERAFTLALQGNGAIVVAGAGGPFDNEDTAVARYTGTGDLDTTFSSDGKLIQNFGNAADVAWGAVVQADRKIVLAGHSHNGSDRGFTLIRLNPDGGVDTSFGVNGRTLDMDSSSSEARDIALLPDGKFLVAGYTDIGTTANLEVKRFTADGALDSTFGVAGKVTNPIDSFYPRLAVQSDGKFVIAGAASNGTDSDVVLLRYNSAGSLDNTFGNSGKVITRVFDGDDFPASVVLQPDGKIVVSGTTLDTTGRTDHSGFQRELLLRYNVDGSLDATFGGGDGIVVMDFGPSEAGRSVVIQADGKIVVAGYVEELFKPGDVFPDSSFLIARFNADGSLDTSFGIGAGSYEFGRDLFWRNSDGRVVEWQMSGLAIAKSADFGVVPMSWTIVDTHSDFNGDGIPDALWRDANGTIAVWQLAGFQISSGRELAASPTTWNIVSGHVDLNGDRDTDILWRDSHGAVAGWQLSGTTMQDTRDFGTVALSYSIIDPHSDFNGDGKSDVLWRDANGMVSAWQMNGLNIQAAKEFGVVAPNWTIVTGHADFNGDGKSDVLWRGPDGMVSAWQMNGLNIAAGKDFAVVANSWTIIDAHGNYNGDGMSDILWRNSDGMTSVWLMNGLNIASARDIGVVATSWTIMDGHADLDGDGKSDVLWRNSDGMVSAWLMNGTQIASGRDIGLVPTSWTMPDAGELGGSFSGDAGNDMLLGTLNNDTLFGRGGNDVLTGNAGADRFVFNTALNASTNVDTITDFRPLQDTLLLSDVIFSNLSAGKLAAGNFVSGPGATAQDGNDYIVLNTTTGQLSYDADGSGAGSAVVFAVLANLAQLTANDIQVGVV